MANEIRSRANLVNGTLSVALLAGDTTMSSAGLANLPAITSANHAVVVIENEIVYVTAHTASATTATILRAQEGTSAAAHAQNVAWLHGPVVSDFDSVLNRAAVTANQASITTLTALTGLSVTVTVPYAQHLIRVTGHVLFQNTSIARCDLQILKDASQAQLGICVPAAINTPVSCDATLLDVPTAGSHTYSLSANPVGGGTITMVAGATLPAFILVEDLGPAL